MDPNRLFASQCSGWFGQVIQRSDDGGKTWTQPGTPPGESTTGPGGMPKAESNKFVYDASAETGKPLTTHHVVRRHASTPGNSSASGTSNLRSPIRTPCTPEWKTPRSSVPRTAARSWHELSGLRGHGTGPRWQPGAGGMCLHTIILDPGNPVRIFIAISAAGAFRTDDGGKTWKPINKAWFRNTFPIRRPKSATAFTTSPCTLRGPDALFMQKHWDVMRSDDAGDYWHEVSGNLPTDFGFVIDVHAHEPETIYVVPIKSDGEHFPIDGKLRVYRSRTGGNEWEALTKACRNTTATSTSCATPWPSTRSINAASISAPPAARSTPPPTPETPGRRSSAIFRPFFRSKSRRSHDPRRFCRRT